MNCSSILQPRLLRSCCRFCNSLLQLILSLFFWLIFSSFFLLFSFSSPLLSSTLFSCPFILSLFISLPFPFTLLFTLCLAALHSSLSFPFLFATKQRNTETKTFFSIGLFKHPLRMWWDSHLRQEQNLPMPVRLFLVESSLT